MESQARHANIDPVNADPVNTDRDADRAEHYNRDFPHYAPAYQFGNWLASQSAFRNRSWTEIEEEARREWETTHARPWEEYAAVVRHAWNDTRNDFSTTLRDATEEGNPRGSMEDRFHSHFEQHYASRGHDYRSVAPAYHFGFDLAVDSRYRNREWEEVRAEAEQRWNKYGVNFFWDAAEPAIAYAWRIVRSGPLGAPHHVSEFEGFGAAFYEDFRANHAASGFPYEAFALAYYLGYDLASDREQQGSSWDAVRQLARERWSQQVTGDEQPLPAWEQVEDAVRFAWQRVRETLEGQSGNRRGEDDSYGTNGGRR